MIIKYLIIVVLVMTGACTSPDEDKVDETIESWDQLYPLAVDNYWSYNMYYSSQDTSYQREYRIQVIGKDTVGDDVWFRIGEYWDNIYSGYDNYLIEHDSVFMLQHNFQTPVRSLQYIVPEDSAQVFRTLIGGDVVSTKSVELLDRSVSTPLSNFEDCYSYSWYGYEDTQISILKYGVGLVKMQHNTFSLMTHDTIRQVFLIKEINIENEP